MTSTIKLPVIFGLLCLFFIYFSGAEGQACPSDKDKDWSWDPQAPNGPSHWGDKYPACNGKKQSPINLDYNSAQKKGRSGLPVTNYDKPIKKATIRNKGYILEIVPTDGVERSVQYDGKTYNLKSLHFHWGHKVETSGVEHNSDGSEHSISARRSTKKYSMEVHLGHFTEDGKIIGIAGFLGESFNPNPSINEISNLSPKVEYMGDQTEVSYGENDTGINLMHIIRTDSSYFTYEGSFTIPPCTEGVTWMVATAVSIVNVPDIFEFEQLRSVKKGDPNEDKCFMVDIYRPIQPLNGRTVYKTS